jgi:hypothetical protein
MSGDAPVIQDKVDLFARLQSGAYLCHNTRQPIQWRWYVVDENGGVLAYIDRNIIVEMSHSSLQRGLDNFWSDALIWDVVCLDNLPFSDTRMLLKLMV